MEDRKQKDGHDPTTEDESLEERCRRHVESNLKEFIRRMKESN